MGTSWEWGLTHENPGRNDKTLVKQSGLQTVLAP